MNNSYPTVATILGCPEELKSADGLVATPIVLEEDIQMAEPSVQQLLPNDTSQINDPVQKALVDNILGNIPNKATQEKLKCELCKIEVNGRAALLTHLSGAKHARRVKEETMTEELQSPYIEYLKDTKMYHCKLCNTTLNAKIQISAHLQGTKHKNKIGGKTENAAPPSGDKPASNSVPKEKKQGSTSNTSGSGHQYCPTCKLHTNSEVQLQQHMASKKHLNKLNNVIGPRARPAPYPSRSPKSNYMPNYISNKGPMGSGYSGYSRRSNGPNSYNQPSFHDYGDLSNNFLSGGIYGGGHHGYGQQQQSYRSSYHQAQTYG